MHIPQRAGAAAPFVLSACRFSVGRGGGAGSAACASTRARNARADVHARAERTTPRWRGAGAEHPHTPARARQRPSCFQPNAYGDWEYKPVFAVAVGIMEIEHLIRYAPLAVGLKPSAIQGEARLCGLERIISSKTISPRQCAAKPACAGSTGLNACNAWASGRAADGCLSASAHTSAGAAAPFVLSARHLSVGRGGGRLP